MRRTEKVAEKRNRILEAAFNIFLEGGYAGARMSAIAERAGLGKSTLYDYFTSKEDLFRELLRNKVEDPWQEILREITGEKSCRAQIEDIIRAEVTLCLKYHQEADVFTSIMANPEFLKNDDLNQMVGRVLSRKYYLIRDLIACGTERGEFRDVNPMMAALSIIGASNAFLAAIGKASFREDLQKHPIQFAFDDIHVFLSDQANFEAFFDAIFGGLI